MTQDITSLIEKLEQTEVGSRELDGAVWYAVHEPDVEHGCLHVEQTDQGPMEVLTCELGSKYADCVGNYTTSLDAALALAERVLPGWHVGVQPWFHTDPDRVMSRAYLIRPDWKRWNPTGDEWCDQHHGRSSYTPALAVVSALLRAQSEARV